jgi:hypothetical protein
MPAVRKPEGQRVRRNLEHNDALPAEGYRGRVPDWPYQEGTELELELWGRLWRSPMAAKWATIHNERQVARLVRLDLIVEAEMGNNMATAQTLNSLLALEKQLGMGPDSLRLLSWKVAVDEVGEQREAAAPRRRLKAVDAEGSA